MAMQAAKRDPLPKAPGEIPKQDKIFREFKGINTQAARESIEPEQFSWLENLMPIGFGNLKVVKAQSAILATLAATAYYRKGFNISNVAYMFYACSDGSAFQVNLTTFAITSIAVAGTFPASGTQVAQWKNERILIINANNYYDWNGAARTALGGTTSAPTAGQCIATYAGRVWISNGRTINYSKAGSYTDFGAPGGNTIISDSTLTSDIRQLLSANNFLYFFGDDSVNVIADVSVNAAGTATLFSNTNISANSGTNLPQTIFPYYRAIWYMNSSGIFGLYGATPRKSSDDLDGIFPLIDFTRPVTGGTAVIYNILCACFMFTYNDPLTGTGRKVLAVYFNKKWFVASQGDSLIGMTTATLTTGDTIYADDGTRIYAMFSSASGAVNSKLQTALWDMGEMVRLKQALMLGVECNVPAGVASISPTVDTELSSQAPTNSFASSFSFTWYGITPVGGLNYLNLPGGAADFATTPDSTNLDIVGDIDIQVYLAATDWTPANRNPIVEKAASFDVAFIFDLRTDGKLTMTTSTNGISQVISVSTAAVGAADGSPIWIRVTVDVDNGASGNTVTFYTSPDEVVWTTLGIPVINVGTTNINNSSGALFIGHDNSGSIALTNNFIGRIYQCRIYSGILGILKAAFNATDFPAGYSYLTSATTGETYTINGAASLDGTHIYNPTGIFTWTNSLGATFTWLTTGYAWLIGDVQTQGHYLGITITSATPQLQYIGQQLQYRTLPGGWWD